MTPRSPRGICPVCHHSIALEAGRLAVHYVSRGSMIAGPTKCTGSRKPPETTP